MFVFYAFPFAQLCNTGNGQVETKYRQFFDSLKSLAKSQGFDYFLAHERENWGADYKGPEECVPIDYKGIRNADIIIVVPGNPISGGVHVEMGWASANNKKMHIFLEHNQRYSPVVMGLGSLTNVVYHFSDAFPSQQLFDDIKDVLSKEGI